MAIEAAPLVPRTLNSRKITLVAAGVIFGVASLFGVIATYGGGTSPSAVATQPTAAEEQTKYTVEDTPSQPASNVLGAVNNNISSSAPVAMPGRVTAGNRPVLPPPSNQTVTVQSPTIPATGNFPADTQPEPEAESPQLPVAQPDPLPAVKPIPDPAPQEPELPAPDEPAGTQDASQQP